MMKGTTASSSRSPASTGSARSGCASRPDTSRACEPSDSLTTPTPKPSHGGSESTEQASWHVARWSRDASDVHEAVRHHAGARRRVEGRAGRHRLRVGVLAASERITRRLRTAAETRACGVARGDRGCGRKTSRGIELDGARRCYVLSNARALARKQRLTVRGANDTFRPSCSRRIEAALGRWSGREIGRSAEL